ncbi:hypothetical protein BC834DRAFT_973702 [Gloeopeniophorella convolvens]|nr:hypothetical protein BC834DRAFT_973702 [Gloeopeniophorella convolvens]
MRDRLHRFSETTTSQFSIFTMANMLSIMDKLEHLERNQNGTTEMIKSIQDNTRARWKLNPEQASVLKQLVRHWLISPVNSYNTIINKMEKWLRNNAADALELPQYEYDQVIQEAVRQFVNQDQHSHRSNMRKKIFASITGKTKQLLKRFSDKLIHKYYRGHKPDTLMRMAIKAQLALARVIALPLTKKKNKTRADTGFWTSMNEKLAGLRKENGSNRTDPKWLQWYKEIINKDKETFSRARRNGNGSDSNGANGNDGDANGGNGDENDSSSQRRNRRGGGSNSSDEEGSIGAIGRTILSREDERAMLMDDDSDAVLSGDEADGGSTLQNHGE